MLIISFVFCCTTTPESNMREDTYTIDVWDFNSSMSYVIHYHIDNDSLVIKMESGIEGENSAVLVKRKMSEKEAENFKTRLTSLPLNELKSSYSNPLIEDGDQKSIKILLGQNSKEIEISNVYVSEIAKLFDYINNLLLDEKYKISYSKE